MSFKGFSDYFTEMGVYCWLPSFSAASQVCFDLFSIDLLHLMNSLYSVKSARSEMSFWLTWLGVRVVARRKWVRFPRRP